MLYKSSIKKLSSNYIGINLKKFRCLHNMTQEDLANKVCISKSALSHYEIGRRMPDIDTLILMANILNVQINEMLISYD